MTISKQLYSEGAKLALSATLMAFTHDIEKTHFMGRLVTSGVSVIEDCLLCNDSIEGYGRRYARNRFAILERMAYNMYWYGPSVWNRDWYTLNIVDDEDDVAVNREHESAAYAILVLFCGYQGHPIPKREMDVMSKDLACNLLQTYLAGVHYLRMMGVNADDEGGASNLGDKELNSFVHKVVAARKGICVGWEGYLPPYVQYSVPSVAITADPTTDQLSFGF